MKTIVKILLVLCIVGNASDANAQIFKRLKNKIKDKLERKVEEKVEKEIDETIDDIGKKKDKKTNKTQTQEGKVSKNKSFGSVFIKHNNTYGNVDISSISQVKVVRTKNGYTVNGSWWTHEADIYDGFRLQITTDKNLKHDEDGYDENTIRTFKIPEEAQLKLAYDPKLPYNKTSSTDNFKRAVTDDYQDVDISRGEVSVDVLSNDAIQISFSGDVTFRKVIRKNETDDYNESFYESSITGAVDAQSPTFTNSFSARKDEIQNSGNTQGQVPEISESTTATTPGVFQFNFESEVKITNLLDNETYNVSYLLNPNAKYVGMKVDIGAHSDNEVQGESIIVLNDGNAQIFVEAQGMKLQMPQSNIGNQQMQNLTDQMAKYDYTNLKKTGNTKTVLGAKCYEYTMAGGDVKMNLWVAPAVNLSNWFIQNTDILKGHIMEYTVQSKDGNMKSETIAINDNISKTINTKDYKKMF